MSARSRRERLERSRLYLVCDTRAAQGDLTPFLDAALGGGVDIVQLRDKQASDAELDQAAAVFKRLTERHGALFILNDRPDLAVAVGADGVHIGQDDAGVAQARAEVGSEMLIGLSTHSVEQVDALGEDIDYFAVGPVHATPTKPTYEPVGLDLVRYAAETASRPFFAIGGIDAANAAEVIAAGARRVAVVRAIGDAADPRRAATELLDAITVRV